MRRMGQQQQQGQGQGRGQQQGEEKEENAYLWEVCVYVNEEVEKEPHGGS